MKKIKPSFEFVDEINGNYILKRLEKIGRVCYQSDDKICEGSAEIFIKEKCIELGHESILEHQSITISVICDRGISHELVRHRTASYGQESTRYVKATGKKYPDGMEIIQPCFWNEEEKSECNNIWNESMLYLEQQYNKLLDLKASPQQARSILPNSLKTQIIITNDLRNWRWFFNLRCHKSCHPQMLEITLPMLKAFSEKIPIVFDDLTQKYIKGL